MSISWLPLAVSLAVGLSAGLGVSYVLQRARMKSVKDVASELLREAEAERKRQLDAVIGTVTTSFGELTAGMLAKSTEEVVRLAKSRLDAEREAAGREWEAKKDQIDRQLHQMSAELGTISSLIRGLEGQKSEEARALAQQLRNAREQAAALMDSTQSLAAFMTGERQRGEDALRESEERVRALAAASPIPMALCRAADTVILYGNQEFGALFGAPTEALARRRLSELMAGTEERQALLKALRQKDRLERYDVRFTRLDGKPFWASVSAQSLVFDGAPAHLWGLVDVTPQKRAMEELQSSQALLVTTLESTSDGMLVVNQARDIVCCNQKFTEMWKVPDSVMATRNDNHFLTFALDQVRDPTKFLAKVRQLYAQPESESYDVVEFKDGRLFERYSQAHRLGGQAVGRIWSFRDITERKWGEEALEKALRESEEQLRQSQKLEAIGQLAGGIAHDFNNLLTIITGYSQFLLGSLDPQGAAYRDVTEIRKATKRASALTQQLLAFSRKQSRQPLALDLNDVVTDLTKMLRRLLGEHINLVTELSEAPALVLEDPTQIEQVIMNLAVNARDAMPKGGTLAISTVLLDLDEAFSRTHPGTKPGAYVRLTVSDTGVGMDAKTLARCFEPFFTTKPSGQGTGLGLATVYGIVKQSDGAIDIRSQVGEGTTVTVFLRRWNAEVGAPAEAVDRRSAPGGTETILVVEDDAVVRALVRKVIEQHGYTVFDAFSGPAALALAGPDTQIDLLVTDVVMPEMSGPDLVARLAAARPGLKVLYLTGYADAASFNRPSTEALLLQKPFTPEELAVKVREALDSGVSVKHESAER